MFNRMGKYSIFSSQHGKGGANGRELREEQGSFFTKSALSLGLFKQAREHKGNTSIKNDEGKKIREGAIAAWAMGKGQRIQETKSTRERQRRRNTESSGMKVISVKIPAKTRNRDTARTKKGRARAFAMEIIWIAS